MTYVPFFSGNTLSWRGAGNGGAYTFKTLASAFFPLDDKLILYTAPFGMLSKVCHNILLPFFFNSTVVDLFSVSSVILSWYRGGYWPVNGQLCSHVMFICFLSSSILARTFRGGLFSLYGVSKTSGLRDRGPGPVGPAMATPIRYFSQGRRWSSFASSFFVVRRGSERLFFFFK